MTDLEEREKVIRLVGGYMVANAMRTAIQLGVLTKLDEGPKLPSELADELGIPADNLRRLLSLLLLADLLGQDEDQRVYLTRTGRLLLPDSPDSLASFVRNFTSPLFQRAWDHLEETVRDGTAGFVREYGEQVYEYLGRHESDSELFNLAMHDEATATARAAADLIKLDTGETVVDVGGGDGTFLTTLLEAKPEARGVIFDSPSGIAQAQSTISSRDLDDRCTAVGGSFFESIPTGGTTYILKSVFQDWGDNDVLRILQTCRGAMNPEARLLIIGNVLPEQHDSAAAVGHLTDVCMLVISGGRERTEPEFRDLLSEAGFRTNNVQLRPLGPLSTIEARPMP